MYDSTLFRVHKRLQQLLKATPFPNTFAASIRFFSKFSMILKTPTPMTTDPFYLSALDQNTVRVYTQTILTFDFPDGNYTESAIAALEDGLRKTLAQFPFLAGTLSLRDTTSGKLILTIPTEVPSLNDSTIFATKTFYEFPYTYEELKRKGMPPSAFQPEFFVPKDLLKYSGIPQNGEGIVNFEKSSAPVMRIQANFIPGGLVIAMYFHHTVLDCSGICNFWKVFAEQVSISRQLSEGHNIEDSAPNTVPDQSALRWEVDARIPAPLPGQRLSAESYIEGTYIYPKTLEESARRSLRYFVISASRIRDYRERLKLHFPKESPPTICNVLAALLWIHVTRARAARLRKKGIDCSQELTNIGIATDLRKRLIPELDISYMGNMALFSKGTLKVGDLTVEGRVTDKTIINTIKEIQRTIQKVDDCWVQNHVRFFKSIQQIKDTECALGFFFGLDIYITSWMNFGADFQWGIPGTDLDESSLAGRPDFIRRSYGPSDGGMMIMPRRRKLANGIEAPYEVMVRLAEVDMKTLLEEEGGLSSWAERVID